MSDFDYDRAEADLYEAGCDFAEEIHGYKSDRGIRDLMGEYGLNADRYYDHPRGGSGGGLFDDPGGDDGGCYLTTACTAARGLPDNCAELQTLRAFRDGYLKNSENGPADIAAYYATAPAVVAAINRRPERAEIWETVYTELVAPCVEMIRAGSNEDAYRLYKDYAQTLNGRYGVC